jgi:hypothetical protein
VPHQKNIKNWNNIVVLLLVTDHKLLFFFLEDDTTFMTTMIVGTDSRNFPANTKDGGEVRWGEVYYIDNRNGFRLLVDDDDDIVDDLTWSKQKKKADLHDLMHTRHAARRDATHTDSRKKSTS